MKHISKKLLIMIISLAIVATGTVVFFACQPEKSQPTPPKNGHTVSMTPPTDGSLPEDYEGIENLAFMAGRLAARNYYHSQNNGLVDTIAKQEVIGSKDYYNGILITRSISQSAFANVAQQKFFGDGKVVIRGPKYGKDKWNGLNTEWSNDKPVSVLGEEQYAEKYGLWADEFSDYVLNAETILEVSALSKTDDGNYSQTFQLDPDGATYYYKRQMRTMGNLGDYPSFSAVRITFKFDETWALLQVDIEESYKVSISVLNVSCKATSTIVYSYDESDVDVSAYESYFKNYADAPATGGEDQELGTVDYLQRGFAGYLAKPSTFALNVSVNGSTVEGLVTLNLANGMEIRAALGKLVVNVKSDAVYISYKDFVGKLSLSDISGAVGGGLAGLDTDALMEQLASGTITKQGENVAIDCNLTLGELSLPLRFAFTDREGDVSFVSVSASLTFDSLEIEAFFAPAEKAETVKEIDAELATDLNPYIESVMELVKNKSFSLALAYENEESGLSVSGEAYINAAIPAVSGTFSVGYAGLQLPVSFTYAEKTVYLQVFNIQLKTEEEYLVQALQAILEYANITLPETDAIDLTAVISAVITADYDAAIKTLALTDESLTLAVDLDVLFPEYEIGEFIAEYEPLEKAFEVTVLGVNLAIRGVSPREVGAPADRDEYMDISLLEEFVGPIISLTESSEIAFAFVLDTEIEGIELKGELKGEVKIAEELEIYLEIEVNGKRVEVLYANGTVYMGMSGVQIKVAESELQVMLEKLGVISSKAEGEKEMLQLLSPSGLNVQSLLESIRLTGVEENGAAILRLFADLGLLDENLTEIRAEISTDGKKIKVRLEEGIEFYGIRLKELRAEVYAGEEEYGYDFSGAVDAKAYIDSIYEILEKQSIEVSISYEGESGIRINGSIYANVKAGGVEGELTVRYGELTIPVMFTYAEKEIYAEIYGIKLKTTEGYAIYAVETALKYANVSLPEAEEKSVSEIIGMVMGADWSEIVKKASITEEELSLEIDGDALLRLVTEQELNVGKLTAEYRPLEKAFEVTVLGVNLAIRGVSPREVGAPADTSEYVQLSLLEKFVEPVLALSQSDDIAFAFEFATRILDIDMNVALSGEVKFAETLKELYLKAEIFLDGYADEIIEILYAEDYVTIVYEGRSMRIAETQLSQLAQKLSGLFAVNGETTGKGLNAAMLLFSEDGIDLQALLQSLRLSGSEENGIAYLDLFVDLGIINGNLSEADIRVSTDGNTLSAVLLQKTNVFGLEVSKLGASVWPAENEFLYDFTNAVKCKNVFEFILNAYTVLADTQYLNIAVDYESELLVANIEALFEFVPVSDSAEMTINFDICAEIHTYVYSETGEKVADGSHYLNMVTVGGTSYVSYSLFGYNASNALYVSIPVDQLFVIGNMVLPLMTIDEGAYYYNLVQKLLSTEYKEFSSGIFNAIEFADVLKLLDGISAEGLQTNGSSGAKLSDNLGIFALSHNENGDAVFSLSGITVGEGQTLSLALTAQKSGSVAYDSGKSYIDISSIAVLGNDVLNAYAYTDTGYALSGEIGLSFSLLGLDIPLDLSVKIDLRVGVEENGTPYLNVKLNTNGYNNAIVLLIFGTQVIVNGDTETDITYKDGMIYMTRAQTTYWGKKNWYETNHFISMTPEYTYRKMTLAEFGSDMMNQLFFAINLSDGAKDYIVKQINNSSSSGSGASTYDAGDMVQGYTYANNKYSLLLNVGAIANDSALGTLSVDITRTQFEGRDYYDLTNLTGSIKLVSIITASFNLNHTSCGSQVDLSVIDTNIARVNTQT